MKRILALVMAICLVGGILSLPLASCQAPNPTELVGEYGLAIINLLAAALPEAFWAFIRGFVCGGMLPALIELPQTFFDVSPSGTLLGFGFGIISCGLLFIPGCLLGMYADSEQWAY